MEILEAGLAGDQEIISLRRQIHLIQRMRFGAMCALGIPVLLWFLKVLNPLWLTAILGGILSTLFLLGGLKGGRQKGLERRRNAHLDKHSVSLQQAEDRDIELINKIEEDWDEYCVNFPGYPPDWRYRTALVRERDNYTCCECGWPKGVLRMIRLLHVHHKEPLSRGGSRPNALTNLVTLCDICHREQEGPGHARINPRRRKKPNAAM